MDRSRGWSRDWLVVLMLGILGNRPILPRAILALCVVSTLLISVDLRAVEGAVRSWTETSGAVPAPAVPPKPAIKSFNPKQTSVFTDKEVFLDTVTCNTISMESFEDLMATNRINTSVVTVADFTITTDITPRLGIWDRESQGASATDGRQWVGIEENQIIVPQVTTLNFDVLINQFGFFATDYGDFGDGNLIFANDAGDEATAAFSGEPSGNRQFFGIINTSKGFRSVTLTHSLEGEFYGVDEIYYCFASGAPETPTNRQSSGRVIPD